MPASLDALIERDVLLRTTPERAFAFWTDPELLVRWMGDRAVLDPRPGGGWRLEYGGRYVAAGKFVELDPPRRLVLTWGWEKGDPGAIGPGESRVEVTFEPEAAGTRMRLRHSDLPAAERPGHAEGWDVFLPRLAAATGGAEPGPAPEDAGMSGASAPGASPGAPAAGTPRAVADVEGHLLIATVELPLPPERVFPLLASDAITAWWVRPGVFDTREWTADVRAGGRWAASGIGGGRPYTLEGEFVEVDAPRRLVHTWRRAGAPGAPSVVTYLLEPTEAGTWLTLRQSGLASRDQLIATAIGWETSFDRLVELVRTGRLPG